MDTGKLIRKYRLEKGLTAEELGKKIGFSKDYVSKIELGKRHLKTDVLLKIAEILDKPIESFYPDDLKRTTNIEGQDVLIIDKNKHNLKKYSDEEILEFIRLGKSKKSKEIE